MNANPTSSTRPNLDPDALEHPAEEEGEAMDDMNDEDSAMMAMMGMNGFGSTKVLVKTRCKDILAHESLRESMW